MLADVSQRDQSDGPVGSAHPGLVGSQRRVGVPVTPTGRRLRTVVAGTRGHASRVAIPTVRASQRAELVGLLGSNLERTAAVAGRLSVAAYESVEDVVASGHAEAVWITVPSYLHADMALAFLSSGVHVLLEKPMATDEAAAARLVAASDKSTAVLRVAYQHRFREPHQLLRGALARQAMGEMGNMRIHRYWKFPYFAGQEPEELSEWRAAPETSGGWVINDIGSHLVDLVLWLAGAQQVSLLSAIFASQFPEIRNDSSNLLTLRIGSGCLVEIDCSNRFDSPGSLVEAYGGEGWVRLTGSFGDVTTIESSIGLGGTIRTSNEAVYLRMFDDFVDAALGEPSMGAGPREGMAGVRLIQHSRRLGRDLDAI